MTMRTKSILLTILIFSTFSQIFSQTQTGTLSVFSELGGITIYLNDNLIGNDVKVIKDVPVGSHYLKVLRDGSAIYSEIVNIQANTVTTVLIKNTFLNLPA